MIAFTLLSVSIQRCKFAALFHFDIMNVQHQTNLSDCGLFAIAFTTELAHGQSPLLCDFNTSLMRSHLLTCLEDGVLRKFPLRREAVPFW